MDLHDFLDAIFYKDDKKTGERKVSCCKLLIVVIIIFMIIGMIGNATDSDKDNAKKESTKSVKENDSVDMMDALDIEAFTEDTVVTVWNKDFLIPKGYGENINARVVDTQTENGLTTHNGLYMYYNGHSYISIGYISFEGVSMDDGMLSDDGVWEKVGGYEGKLNHDNDGYSFEFIENGNSYTVYADSEDDIEKVLM